MNEELRSAARGSSSLKRPEVIDSTDLPHAPGCVPIQCQFCVGQSFRRSRLRGADLKHLLLMRYPVRCLRCGQRQMVSYTVAGISTPSHVGHRRGGRSKP